MQGNVWAIHHNEREFPDPDRFNPDRYMPGSPDSRPFPGEKGYMTFGWGRRVCSGQGLAEQGTFITIARLLWGFKIEKAKDEKGDEIPVDIFDYTYVSASDLERWSGANGIGTGSICALIRSNAVLRLAVRRFARRFSEKESRLCRMLQSMMASRSTG